MVKYSPEQPEVARTGVTAEEYLTLDDDTRYQLIHGNLIREPAPLSPHQLVVGELFRTIQNYLYERTPRPGAAFVSPFDVVLDDANVVQPDVGFITRDRLEILGPKRIHGCPDLVVEVLSPSTADRDWHTKRRLYQRFGAREYWIVDTEQRLVHVERFQEDTRQSLGDTSRLETSLLPGFSLTVKTLFDDAFWMFY